MPYSRLPIPVQGLTDSLSFRQAAEGFTKRCKNVFPFDAFDNKRRVGTRQGFLQIGKVPGANAEIQGMATSESLVDKTSEQVVKRQLIYVALGKVYVTDLSGDPVQAGRPDDLTNNAFSANYDSESTDPRDQPRDASNKNTVEALPNSVSGDQIFATDASVEIIAFRHVGRRDEDANGADGAVGTITFTGVPAHDETIVIVDNTPGTTAVSVTYTATNQTDDVNGVNSPNFYHGADATEAAANLKAAIEATNKGGHNKVGASNGTTFHIATSSDGGTNNKLTLTQKFGGSRGNTTITSGLANCTVTDFTGGTDDEPHQYAYMTDGVRYVKVDLSQNPPVVSQWIGPYKTVKADFAGTTYFAPLVQRHGARLVMAGLKPAGSNWFLSKINDPFDWTPGAGVSVGVEAVAGSSGTTFGQIGDNIKALIPVGTNSLVFGCTNSMTMLTGDPAFSDVKFRQVSRTVGVLGPRAFTPVNEMSTLVASSEGVFGIDPNTFDIERGARVSRDRLDNLFSRLDFENTNVVMGYDDARSVALMFVTKTDDPTSSEIFALDMSNGGWWQWQIANSDMRGVQAVVSFRPVDGDRSTPWLGTKNGHLLAQPEGIVLHQDGGVDSSSSFSSTHPPDTSAGVAIDFDSEIVIGPINSDPSRRIMLKDVRVLLGEKSEADADTLETGPFMSLLFGDTAQNAIGFVSGGALTTTTTLIDAGGAATYTPSDTYDGGDESGSITFTATLWGGRAIDADGTYSPSTTGTLLNNTTFSGPGNWTLSRNSGGGADDGKWELKYSGAVYYQTTNAVSGLPTTIPLDTDFVGTGEEATLVTTGFAGAQSTSNVQLARGRSTAKRSRTRASDIFVKIGANSRAWALEDVSVDVEDGGPVRSVS
jgi:hypothetical protein